MSNQRKRIAVLCVLLVVGGGWVGLASRQAGTQDHVAVLAADSDQPAPGDPDLSASPGVSPITPLGGGLSSTELFFKMMLSVGLVIALGAAALYLSKRVLPKVANASGREIRILETAGLGPRKALHLVEVGHQRLLIASTNDTITTLAHVDDAWLDIAKPEPAEPVKM